MVFKRTPPGKKTVLMLQVEARLCCTLEEDYQRHYLGNGLGQKRLADRWGVKRNTIFESNVRSHSRSWVEMLGLPVRRIADSELAPLPRERPSCEACAENSVSLERAHWIEASKGGKALPNNIVFLCPNCHPKLDLLCDPITTERARAALLHRTAKNNLASTDCSPEQFLKICRQIVGARAV